MKFGYVLPNYGGEVGPRELVTVAKLCEEEGFDSVWATDHVLMPLESREPYGNLLEPLVTLSFVAAATERVRVGTSVVVLPQRNPILVAKQAAAIDAFSGGRLLLGFGTGWAEKEFGFLGADFRKRGRVMDESIRLIRRLWSDDVVDFNGSFFRVERGLFLPKPAGGSIPIWVAGNSDRAVARAVRLGDGWHPTGLGLKEFSSGVEKIRSSGRSLTLSMRISADMRRKREDVVAPSGERRTFLSGSPAEVRKSLEEYVEAGLEYPCVSLPHQSGEETMEEVRAFARDVVRSYS